jgi:hypothetical protein
MNVTQSTTALAVVCLLLMGSAFASRELLYVQEGQNLVTYTVNPTTALATKISSLSMHASPTYPIQIFHVPKGQFLYILGFTSATQEYFWVYALAGNGAPTPDPIQLLQVKPSLTQFVFHPNGNFGYGEYSWTQLSSLCNGPGYYADIVLYTVDSVTGKLTDTNDRVANFPDNCSNITYLYGLNSTGTKLYTYNYPAQASYGDANLLYSYSAVNSNTGSLGPQVEFWDDSVSPEGERSAFTNQLIAQSYAYGTNAINVYLNTVFPQNAIINCTSTMLQVCGDSIFAGDTESGLYFDPTGQYLFVLDATTNQTPILHVDLTNDTLTETGSFLSSPVVPVFSHDGKMVYGNAKGTVLVNAFDQANGESTASSTISVPEGSQIFAW